jgi:malonyl-CoA O-methyltransferase
LWTCQQRAGSAAVCLSGNAALFAVMTMRIELNLVIPAKTGIALDWIAEMCPKSDSRLRGNDEQKHISLSPMLDSHHTHPALPREIGERLLESLDYFALRDARREPQVVLDIGCGLAQAASAMKQRWPRAQVIALDLALPTLQQAKRKTGRWWQLFGERVARVNADAGALPLADASVDVLYSNLCLPWVEDWAATFANFRRVLKPGGMLLCSTLGAETSQQLCEAIFTANSEPARIGMLATIAQFGDALMHAGFRDPVLDRDCFATAGANGMCEAIYAHAWAPPVGAPIRDGSGEIAAVPLSAIRVRRRE